MMAMHMEGPDAKLVKTSSGETMYSNHHRARRARLASSVAFGVLLLAGTAMAEDGLTVMGAEVAGDPSAGIPAWTGALQADATARIAEAPVLRIDASNLAEHADRVTPGHQALLAAFPGSARLDVYPTHRTCVFPQKVLDAVAANRTGASLANNGHGVVGASIATPFPVASNGLEAVWNHLLLWRGERLIQYTAGAVVHPNGSFTLGRQEERYENGYNAGETVPPEGNMLNRYIRNVNAPARLAGQIMLMHNTLDHNREQRRYWMYDPTQKRVMGSPGMEFDASTPDSEGMQTVDGYIMYNGSPDRYQWTLQGKKVMVVPYNGDRLYARDTKYADVLKGGHPNPDYLRYEAHRVWVVDGVIKEGYRHANPRRTFFMDEDTWAIVTTDRYGDDGKVAKLQEGFMNLVPEVPFCRLVTTFVHELGTNKYFADGLTSEEPEARYGVSADELGGFEVSHVRAAGRR